MREYVSAIGEFAPTVLDGEASGDAGMMYLIRPFQMEATDPWNGGHTEATASQERRLECDLELARLTTAPLPWKSGRLAREPGHPMVRKAALWRGVCSPTTRRVSWSSSPATRKARPRVPVVKDYARAS